MTNTKKTVHKKQLSGVKAPHIIVKDHIVVTKLKQARKGTSKVEKMVGQPTVRSKTGIPVSFSTQTTGSTNWRHAGSCKHPEESIDGIVIVGSQPLAVGELTDTLESMFLDESLATQVNGNLIPLNPDFLNGPIAAQANYRTKYVFTDVEIEYTPAVATSFSGMFSMAIFEDCYLNAPTSFATVLETNPSISTQYWKNFILRYKYRGTRLWFTEALTTTVADRRQTEQCNITAYPLTAATATGTFGFFTIRYRVELYGPISSQGFTVQVNSKEEKEIYRAMRDLLRKKGQTGKEEKDLEPVRSGRGALNDELLKLLVSSIKFPVVFEPVKEVQKVEASSAEGLKIASAVETGLKIANGTISGVKQELLTDLSKVANTAVASTAGALNTISDVTKLGGNAIDQSVTGQLAVHSGSTPIKVDVEMLRGGLVNVDSGTGVLTVAGGNHVFKSDIVAVNNSVLANSFVPVDLARVGGSTTDATSGQLRILGDIDKISGSAVGNAWPVDITKTKSTFLPTTSIPVVTMTAATGSSSLCHAQEELDDYLLLDLKNKNVTPDILARIRNLMSGGPF
jgi:hypothetical protein